MKKISSVRGIKFNRDEIVYVINECVGDCGSQKAFADECGISAQYMSDIIHGRRNIPKKVLDKMGMDKMEIYFYK